MKKLLVKDGDASKSKAVLVGKGDALPDPALGALALPLEVQLVNRVTGAGLASTFQSSDALTNTSSVRKAKH